jgi:DNA primase
MLIPSAPANPIDFAAIAAQVDLQRLIEADLGPTVKGRRWVCPFHANAENANFGIAPDGRHWRCWSCGLSGDAFDYIARRDGISTAEAARILDPFSTRPPGPARSRPKSEPAPAPAKDRTRAWADSAWQAATDAIVRQAEAALWDKSGRDALEWLFARGLADQTIRRFRLGFLPRGAKSDPLEVLADKDGPQPIRAPRGITIPWCHPESWYSTVGDAPAPRWVGVNVRRLAEDVSAPWEATGDKCLCFRGSTRGFPYPFGDVAPGVPALLCEGEFDALVGWQEAGWAVNAVTVGGAQQTPSREALATLDCCPTWLLAFDRDETGNHAARTWWQRNPDKSIRVMLPHGKDLNDFHRNGGDVLGWLAGEFRRLGWLWSH